MQVMQANKLSNCYLSLCYFNQIQNPVFQSKGILQD